MARLDPHSYADSDQPQTKSLAFSLDVDFAKRVIAGDVTLRFHAPGSGPLDLDTRGLAIDEVLSADGKPLPYELGEADPILGARLRIQLPERSGEVRIRYRTSTQASALQWLEPSQTAGGVQPFLYSQCQPIHARSIWPLQDSPGVRVTVSSAQFSVPAALRTLMAAAAKGRVKSTNGRAVDGFEMPQAIPPYLLAFAVGDLSPRQLSRRCAVWAERPVADAAAEEFAGVEDMMVVAEELFGPYEWDRYDILVMPPSFPYGGMENPRLTFATPSILAGDKSLVNVIAHELAHAWTGNLVTNASANDFWLNEGFTVYAERRILEAMEGRASSELHAAIGRHELDETLKRFQDKQQFTKLRNDLWGVDPDQVYSTVPYEKGYLLLRKLEEAAGRPAWDEFLRVYIETFRFRSITTMDFLQLLERELPGLAERANAFAWIDHPGLPSDAPRPKAARLTELKELAARAAAGKIPSPGDASAMSPTEVLLYLQSLPAPLSRETLEAIDRVFSLSEKKSLELRHTFVLAQLRAGLDEGVAGARRVVQESGRMKYLRPIYAELAKSRPEQAREIYAGRREGYHAIARSVIEALLPPLH